MRRVHVGVCAVRVQILLTGMAAMLNRLCQLGFGCGSVKHGQCDWCRTAVSGHADRRPQLIKVPSAERWEGPWNRARTCGTLTGCSRPSACLCACSNAISLRLLKTSMEKSGWVGVLGMGGWIMLL